MSADYQPSDDPQPKPSPGDPYKDNDDVKMNREKAIRSLLDLCASKEIDIADGLRAAILGEEIVEHIGGDVEKGTLLKTSLKDLLSSRASQIAEMDEDEFVKEIRTTHDKLCGRDPRPYECRVINGSYKVTRRVEKDIKLPVLSRAGSSSVDPENKVEGETEEIEKQRATQRIETVMSSGLFSQVFGKLFKTIVTGGKPTTKETKVIADGINLCLRPGKTYLVLGLPGSGKSTLLKMIANTLPRDKNHEVGGTITVNGMDSSDKDVLWSNVSSHIDQIDRLHPYLTVWETCEFSWLCKQGTHRPPFNVKSNDEAEDLIRKLDDDKWAVRKVLEGMGLIRVKDTFVGDTTTVRGVSGGERKRVTVAELAVARVPVLCCDEISTGLDAATTFDIIRLIGIFGRMTNTIRIVSLLQPPPEVVALFDEIILVDSGNIIYSGPVDNVVGHFESLGYRLPARTDVADWLLLLPTKAGAQFLGDANANHLNSAELKERYDASEQALAIRSCIQEPLQEEFVLTSEEERYFRTRYHNSSFRSFSLLLRRELLLWTRDMYQIKARLMQDLIMGIIAGTVFWQQNSDPQSVMGILFQSMFFISVGAMLKVPTQFEPRSIFYKHQDANFYPTWAYVTARSLAGLPTSLIDGLIYGSIIYWFVGLSSSDGASSYFTFMLLVILGSLSSGLVFSIFSATVKDRPTAQACMSVVVVFLVLFSGFTVQPNVIPSYWIWAYWINMFAWILRSLVLNEYTTSKYGEVQANGLTEGENILVRFGFYNDGGALTSEWIWWGLLFALGACVFSVCVSTFFLANWRFQTGKPLGTDIPDLNDDPDGTEVEIPFQKVNLTFRDIHYFVKASTSDEELELLKGVTGFVESGKMTALMGSSGAGKTTLMDCLSLRKTTGHITGEVTLNGHPQEPLSFRRCTGYVEQFDVQSPALTIRETVEFSARLRLEESDISGNEERLMKFIDQTLDMLELTVIEDLQVGSDMTGGLSFEQRKRLSIAVELVSNPSILFLDEPTSGLDARAAGIVMRGLKRIALSGRAVCATIHQPSIAIFNSFDSLLLLKRGGEVVFFGDLGDESSKLIEYLERFEATPKIKPGENPATWMLTCIGAGAAAQGRDPFDYVAAFKQSRLRDAVEAKIEEFISAKSDSNKTSFVSEYATSRRTQMRVVMSRVMKIYWRSPSYNAVRITVSAFVALLFGSVYASQRVPGNESDMNSRVTCMFITCLFLAVNSFNTVLPVFEAERNMFYRHQASKMYTVSSVVFAFSFAEIPFFSWASLVFCVFFYFPAGFWAIAYKFFLYFLFMTLNLGAFTFMGQMMVSLVRDSQAAQGFGGLLITMTSLFSGLLIRPANIGSFWIFAYWLFPGHYVLEGLVTSQFNDDNTPIEASVGSPFYDYLVSNSAAQVPCASIETGLSGICGTAEDWIFVSFGGKFLYESVPWNILYLVGLIVVSRIITFLALSKLNYLSK